MAVQKCASLRSPVFLATAAIRAKADVNRRARRMKTDRIDALKLVQMLVRAVAGERDVWREVRVPPLTVEAARRVSRERTALTQERTGLVNQLRSWLATMGTTLPTRRPPGWWTSVRDWSGAALRQSTHEPPGAPEWRHDDNLHVRTGGVPDAIVAPGRIARATRA